MAARAGHTLGLPINRKRRDVKALPRLRLPGRIHLHRPHHFDAVVVLTVDEHLGIDVAPIQQMCCRQQVFLREGAMHRLCHLFILRGGRGRDPMCDQMRPISITGFGDMRFVSEPCGLPFLTPTGFRIIGGMHHVLGGGHGVGVAPVHLVIVDIILLDPHASQDCHRRMLPQCCRALRGRDPRQQLPPILSNVARQGLPCTVRFGETILVKTRPIPVLPVLGNTLLQPLGGNVYQALQGMAHCFAHTLQTVEVARCRLHVGRVRPLLAPCLQQAALAEAFEQGIQQALCKSSCQEPVAACTQEREVKPRVYEVSPQQILPVNPAPNGIRSLPIREVFSKLQDCDKREAPRRFGRLPAFWKQVLEETLGIHRFQLIAQGQIGLPFGKAARATRAVSSGTCDPGCGHRDMALSPQTMIVKMALILPGFPENGNSPTVS